jgi:ATP-dependent helicase/nuclease subunit A
MADLERAALALLSDAAHAGWVQQRLDLRIQQVLIDEFQDTSPLQWHALFGWLWAYAGAGGGATGQRPPGVFIVGDPKQSIYRFRRAEPLVFEAARDFVVQGLDGQVLACDHTRRNVPAVVDGLNAVFGDAAALDGWGPFRAHTTAARGEGALLALPGVPRPVATPDAPALPRWRDSLTEPRHETEEPLKAIEARRVATSIAHAVVHDELEPGQVMVLSRQRAMLHRVAAELAALGLPCVMPEALSLAAEPESQDLIALLDVLASPGHDLSLARALKSPLFGLSDDDLLALSQLARQARQPWLETLVHADPATPSPAWQRARGLLRTWRTWVQELTPHDLLDRMLHAGDLEARMLAATPPPRRVVARQLLRGLLHAALEHEGGRFVSTYQFVRALKQGRLKASPQVPSGAVRLLTVHGAKGLEADVVYLVDAWPERRQIARSTLLVDWPVDAAAPRVAAFVSSEARMPPGLADLMQREQQERDREEINGLYVAMTRARLRLVVSHTVPYAAGAGRSWYLRLQPVLQPVLHPIPPAASVTTAGEGADEGADAEPSVSAGSTWPPVRVDMLPQLAAAAPSMALESAAGPPQADDARTAALGRAVHRLLEWIGQPDGPLPPARWPAAAVQAAVAFGLPARAGAEVAQLATTIAGSAACARFFSGPALRWAGNEVPMADGQGHALRIDRLVQLEDANGPVWWVLDYKLRHRPEALVALREQLDHYRELVRAALQASGTGDVPVQAGFITGAGQLVVLPD